MNATAPLTASRPLLDILNATRQCVLLVGQDTRIVAANSPAQNVFSRTGDSLEGRRLSEVTRDAQLHDAFQLALAEGASSDLRFELPGDSGRTFDVHISPVELQGERRAIAFFYDITRLERLERVRQEFLSNISHELRTPLTSILAFVETLEDGALDDTQNNRRFVGVIRRNAERMQSLISDILELSMIEAGKISVEIGEFALKPLVDEIFTAVSAKAADRGIEMRNEVSPETTVKADRVRLEQMLTNLIDNAVKFNREAGTVTVACTARSGRSVISVADTGEGILPEHVHRIFERFYRTDRARSQEAGGTGLGLAIVKHLARLQGGEVSVVSEPGRGAVFSISLPA